MSYEEIIDMSHPKSKKHYPMSLYNRAAQFASFAALSGYGEAVSETARLTDSKIEIDEDRAAELDEKMRILRENAADRPQITIEYFVPDENKSGGAYQTVTGNFRRIDDYSRSIYLNDGTIIPGEKIYRIDGEIGEIFGGIYSR